MTDIKRQDKVTQTNINGELVLPIAHYALIDLKKRGPHIISIYGLGSCIAIIIVDQENKLYSISHVLLPKSRIKDSSLRYPHKFVNTSICNLIKNLLKNGALK